MSINPKLVACVGVIAMAIAYVVYLATGSSWQYYLQVDECVAQADQVLGRRLRVSGRVAAGSLSSSVERREVSFTLEGTEQRLRVTYHGSVPDQLAEGKEVVVEGALQRDGELKGETIITKCASKYAPEGTGNSAEADRQVRRTP